MCTRDEICAVMGVTEKTLNRLIEQYLHDDIAPEQEEHITFKDAYAKYSAVGRMSIRRKMTEKALHEGDTKCLLRLYDHIEPPITESQTNEESEEVSLVTLLSEHANLLSQRTPTIHAAEDKESES